jgi:hypothetical protein
MNSTRATPTQICLSNSWATVSNVNSVRPTVPHATVSQFSDIQLPALCSTRTFCYSTWPISELGPLGHGTVTPMQHVNNTRVVSLFPCMPRCQIHHQIISFFRVKIVQRVDSNLDNMQRVASPRESQVYFLFELEFLFLLNLFKERSIFPSYL